jgi:hypothetical protein
MTAFGLRSRVGTGIGSWLGAGLGVTTFGAFESIATTTVGVGGTPTISFADIPQTFKHLQIRVLGRSTGAYTYSSLYVRPNSVSTARYSYHSLYGNGTSAASTGRGTAGGDTAWVAQNISGDTATANNFGSVIVDILDYANTDKYKVMRSLGGYDNNGSGSPIGTISLNSGAFFGSTGSSTEAITSITLLTDGNFKQYTHAALYGIKG